MCRMDAPVTRGTELARETRCVTRTGILTERRTDVTKTILKHFPTNITDITYKQNSWYLHYLVKKHFSKYFNEAGTERTNVPNRLIMLAFQSLMEDKYTIIANK